MLWLLLTGQIPSEEQTRQLSRELAENGDLPEYMEKLIDSCVESGVSIVHLWLDLPELPP